MRAVRFSAVLALVSLSAVSVAQAAFFPTNGKVVPGQSIGGITIGMTEARVNATWGPNHTVCSGCGPNLTWIFVYPGAEPLGAAVKFNIPAPPASAGTSCNPISTKKPAAKCTSASTTVKPTAAALAAATKAKVVAVFTLGSPLGWGDKGEVMMFDPVSNVYNLFGNPGTANCVGFSALTVRIGSNTMSFYSANGVIYGFALTGPTQPACQ